MMKRTTTFLLLFLVAVVMMAMPAKRGLWKTLPLADGSEIRAKLMGDEHAHFWMGEDGKRYVGNPATGLYQTVSVNTLQQNAKRRRAMAAKALRRAPMRAEGNKSVFQGKKRGLIILAEFPDNRFSIANPQARYNRIANEKNYSEGSFQGSVSDYFSAQSNGQFELDFDVAGPVMMSHNYAWYGGNDMQGNDIRPEQMVVEAVKGVADTIDFTPYDWDNDGRVEEVFVVYAGHGEADYGDVDEDVIWPHMYSLSYGVVDGRAVDLSLTYNGKVIDVYACAPELNGNSMLAGIGTFCHEFSHCMGFPDMYDTGYTGNFGMGEFDLMGSGSYNGNGFVPAGYSGYEKMVCGWTNPIELTSDTTITDMKPLSGNGQTYIIYNDGHPDEYYILENRQQEGFDSRLPGKGMLIAHIDYDADMWENNCVNTTAGEYAYGNDHQRIDIFHADNEDDKRFFVSSADGIYYTRQTESTDLYPYLANDSLTFTSKPAATLYHANAKGKMYMGCAITGITQNADGTMSFRFALRDNNVVPSDTTKILPDGTIFFESFDDCAGKGGNDGLFSGSVANGSFNPDNDGWEAGKAFGGYQCAKFNTGNTSYGSGFVYSPYFTLPGDTATLTFNAACWNGRSDGTTLEVSLVGNGSIIDNDGSVVMGTTALAMKRGEWTAYTLKIVGSGRTRILFSPDKRFFLDEVKVVSNKATTGIKNIETRTTQTKRYYTLGGQYIGTDFNSLPKGIYIVDGKKIIK